MIEKILSYVVIAIGVLMVLYFLMRFLVIEGHMLLAVLRWSLRLVHILLLSFNSMCGIVVGLACTGLLPLEGVASSLALVSLPLSLIIVIRCAFAEEEKRPVLWRIGGYNLPQTVLYILLLIPLLRG